MLVQRATEHARSSLTAKDAVKEVARLKEVQPDLPKQARLAREVIHLSHDAAAQVHGSERNWFRSVGFVVWMLVGASALVFASEWTLDLGLIAVTPADPATSAPLPWAMLLLTMLAGAVGALLSGTIALYVRRRPAQDNTYWFDPNRRLLLLKVALGPLVAVAGVALLSVTDVVPVFPSTIALFAAALAFGYAQQLVTRALDRHADDLLTGKQASPSATGPSGGSGNTD